MSESGHLYMVGVAAGNCTDLFSDQGDRTTRFSFRIDVAPWLHDWYEGWRHAFPSGWSIHCVWLSRKYELQDHLVKCFDDQVEWPDYIWGIENLRARRERLRKRVFRPFRPVRRLPSKVETAYDLLNCPVGADLETVNKLYREASHRHHPDKGGSDSIMAGLNKAIGVIRDYWQRQTA
ncbi:MAG: DnaJ domain [Chloroflexi bacterium]|nr:DnaJ domain [Chloroflexota bacterium]